MPNKDIVRTTVVFPKDLNRKLTLCSLKLDRSRRELIIEAIEQIVKEINPEEYPKKEG